MNMKRMLMTLLAGVLVSAGVCAQSGNRRNPAADWPMFNRDLAGTRYSPLTQINTTNVATLTQAWSYRLRPEGKNIAALSPSEIFQEITPIVVNGVMYLPSGNRVVALEPETGKEIWSYELKEGQASFRGVSYWPGDRNNPPRILFTTARKLVAVNAVTGEPSTGFGNNGEVELRIPYDGAPAIFKNIILMGNSTVAVDVETGKLKWYFQTVHHEVWDYNLPPAPSLFDIVKDGKKIPALAQVGKIGYMFILDRVTGKPVFGVEERPVARGNVPTEWYPPTQPFPVRPGPIARISMKREDLVTAEDTTPEHAQACRELWDKNNFYNAGPYTPWSYRTPDNVPPPSAIFPGLTGGPNWGGTAVDPKLGYVFVATKDAPTIGWIQKNPKSTPDNLATEFPFVRVGGPNLNAPIKNAAGQTIAKLPCFTPPRSSLIAVHAGTGCFAWRVPLGILGGFAEGKRNVGSPGAGGPIVTAGGLVFVGATADSRFRAFDSKTGKELWAAKLNYNVTAVPMTYEGKNGKQYVAVVAASGRAGTNTESLVVFALP